MRRISFRDDVEQRRRDYARLLEDLGPPASPEKIRAALEAREPGEPEPGRAPAAESLIGLFADEPELIDEVCRMAMEDRANRSLRVSDG